MDYPFSGKLFDEMIREVIRITLTPHNNPKGRILQKR